jgi:hypothetical protein
LLKLYIDYGIAVAPGGPKVISSLVFPALWRGVTRDRREAEMAYIAKELSGRAGSKHQSAGSKSEKDRLVTGPSSKVDKKAVDMKNATNVVIFR